MTDVQDDRTEKPSHAPLPLNESTNNSTHYTDRDKANALATYFANTHNDELHPNLTQRCKQ